MKKVLSSLIKYPLYLLSLLPFPVLYLIADIVYVIIYYIVGYRKNVARDNLKNSFPEMSERRRREIEKKYFHFLADMMLECVKMLSISKKSIQRRFHLNNPELVKGYLDQGRPVVIVTAHYGNWEWGSLSLSASYDYPLVIIFKPQSNKEAEALMNKVRSRFNAIMVAMRQTLRTLVSFKGRSYWTVFLGDQTPVRHEVNYFTTFLNQKTPVFLGTEKIAKITNAVVIYSVPLLVRRGYYEVNFELITEQPQQTAEFEITEAHTRLLENSINNRPEYWLWSHKRWKNANYNPHHQQEILQ